jgi:hypothetical protein
MSHERSDLLFIELRFPVCRRVLGYRCQDADPFLDQWIEVGEGYLPEFAMAATSGGFGVLHTELQSVLAGGGAYRH